VTSKACYSVVFFKESRIAYKALGLVLLFIVLGCSKKEDKAISGLSYKMATFRLESKGGCESDTLTCATYEVQYPIIKGIARAANDSLLEQIAKSIDTGNPEAQSSSFEDAGALFISDFAQAQIEFPENTMGWYFKASVHVSLLTDTLVSLKSSAEFFTGGAHGGYGTYFINIRPSTGETVTLDNIFRSGYEESLRAIGENVFRKSLNLTDSASLAEEGFEFPQDKFELNDNFGLSKDGILFVFNIYEIAPYVLGAQEILIPYDKIKGLLK
jgi:hypothetical protein